MSNTQEIVSDPKIKAAFDDIETDFKEDFESSEFQVYIAVGAAYRFINRSIESTLYLPLLDIINKQTAQHTVILAFDDEFAKPGSIEMTCHSVQNKFEHQFIEKGINVSMDLSLDPDYISEMGVHKANVMISTLDLYDVSLRNWKKQHKFINIYFFPMGLPTDYFRNMEGKQPQSLLRIEHIRKTYTNVIDYANVCVPKQPIYIELGAFIKKATSVTLFNDAWFHINAQFYSNLYFEDMCELLNIAYASEKPIRIIGIKYIHFENTTPKSLYNGYVDYFENTLTKQTKMKVQTGGRTKRRYTRRVKSRRPPFLRKVNPPRFGGKTPPF